MLTDCLRAAMGKTRYELLGGDEAQQEYGGNSKFHVGNGLVLAGTIHLSGHRRQARRPRYG